MSEIKNRAYSEKIIKVFDFYLLFDSYVGKLFFPSHFASIWSCSAFYSFIPRKSGQINFINFKAI